MRIKFLFVLLLVQTVFAHAQEKLKVIHRSGTERIGNNEVAVTKSGDRPFATHYNEVSPYQIGNKDRVNGYDFDFSNPVKKIQIHVAGLNEGELIEFGINGKKYNLFNKDVTPYVYKENRVTIPAIQDGVIAPTHEDNGTCATITIAPGYDIHSLYVHHLNGKAGGAVFDLFIVNGSTFDNGNGSTSSSGGTANGVGATTIGGVARGTHLLQVFPNPNKGDFVLKGSGYTSSKLELQIVNVSGQVVHEQQVIPSHQNINESISLTQSLPNGVYALYLIDGEKKEVIRFTLGK